MERALGKWRGSTISGYLRGDAQKYRENFRCSKALLDWLVHLLEGSSIDRKQAQQPSSTDWRKSRRLMKANEAHDYPSLRFKVACCLYAIGQGGPIKPLADVCSIGKSTLRKYLNNFADSIATRVKPVYMPCEPMSATEREAVQGQFASRRGMT